MVNGTLPTGMVPVVNWDMMAGVIVIFAIAYVASMVYSFRRILRRVR